MRSSRFCFAMVVACHSHQRDARREGLRGVECGLPPARLAVCLTERSRHYAAGGLAGCRSFHGAAARMTKLSVQQCALFVLCECSLVMFIYLGFSFDRAMRSLCESASALTYEARSLSSLNPHLYLRARYPGLQWFLEGHFRSAKTSLIALGPATFAIGLLSVAWCFQRGLSVAKAS